MSQQKGKVVGYQLWGAAILSNDEDLLNILGNRFDKLDDFYPGLRDVMAKAMSDLESRRLTTARVTVYDNEVTAWPEDKFWSAGPSKSFKYVPVHIN